MGLRRFARAVGDAVPPIPPKTAKNPQVAPNRFNYQGLRRHHKCCKRWQMNKPVENDMEPKELRQRLNGILQAIAAGRSCEQILAADRTLTYHDIFHAVAEAPTSHWDKPPAGNAGKASLRPANSARTPARQRSD